jgi:hypothetical protein
MVRERACELAVINGRLAPEASVSDWEQPKRALTEDPEIDPNQAILESAPEFERWDPVHGSTRDKVRAAPSEEENDEGQSDTASLFEKGVHEDGRDQMLQAAQTQRAPATAG